MKYILPLILFFASCKKEKTECLCRSQVWKKGVYNQTNDPFNGMQTLTFLRYDPYYTDLCSKGNQWYEIDETKKYFLICE